MKRLALLLLIIAPAACGQVIQVNAGASTLFNGEGGSVTFYTPGSTSTVGLGVLNGKLVGGAGTEFEWRHWDVFAGDKQLFLTTGMSGTAVALRGVAVTKKTAKQSLTLFTGATGQAYSTPFFSGTTAKNFGAGLRFERLLSHGFKVSTVDSFAGSRHTVLEEVAWSHGAWTLNENAGLLDNRRFTNATGTFATRHFGAQANHATYIWNGQWLTATSENVAGTYGRAYAYASAFQSRNNRGQAVGGSYRLGSVQLGVGGTFSGKSKTLSGSVMEQVTRHFSLTQYLTRSQGQTQVNFGGQYEGNTVAVGVSYQEMYAPFGPTAFTKVLCLSLRFQHPHGETVDLSTVGKRWTAMGGAYIKTGMQLGDTSQHQTRGSVKGELYRGSVVDEQGNPVAGAAVRVGREIVYSNEQGELMARRKRGGEVTVQVAPEQFVAPGVWECVTCPETVQPGEEFKIVVRRKS
jgi:hypothetical protein